MGQREDRCGDVPVSQICAFNVFPSTLIDRVANSTPMVDFVSRLNSLRVNRESTGGGLRQTPDSSISQFSKSKYARLLENARKESAQIPRRQIKIDARFTDTRVSDEDDLFGRGSDTNQFPLLASHRASAADAP